MAEDLRVDVLLHRLCLTRSRNEAKNACDTGAIRLDGHPAKPSQLVEVGQRVLLRFPHRLLEIEVLEIPGKSVSKKAAKEMYAIARDERIEDSILGEGSP